ncbi:pyridoxal 5'-phosphate synthase glutaminase subunit PdxT [Peribacillus simplex]|uniref:Pyridoxal 5'-phosphate synthase subunit PdxT n=1 Tax=Peribacillus simplex TaxID=1478 RepID=A0AAW7IP05_9BACI|nr:MULTISPECIES: pyridoxal 5'-phosphate synthase glutaminase subunit PdxT [Peribacillus]AMM93296.1 glutamine amidotransferase [Peribacillus simplex]MDF9761310.1 5'-phosphate synthase pdxT subunit [Peribacillus simplex]MDM5294556.1 pyridoxal 5'-phosphate synthase glutaminase subunit PdxT [Peribacillus simplex]MDM5453506.1 pyridoxal 5'-phosphate synthase glutaminase subunit PdxT [Peribacillus simplex]MDV7765325.1 pyridoxal 5'-phosphate synthase glutaminase subunit PdxT [Peribacillus sp. CSMR9]
MITIGVLGLQGAVEEHLNQIKAAGQQAIIVKKPEQLHEIDGLIIPGGESTTMRKLMDRYGFMEPIKTFFEHKKPIFGTCAGMVLAAKELNGDEKAYLELMDISVKRNGFGRQRDSFEAELSIKGLEEPFKAVFIRAPFADGIGEDVEILAVYEENVVAARQEHVLVSAFHPELTGDDRFMQLFIEMVKTSIFKEELKTC